METPQYQLVDLAELGKALSPTERSSLVDMPLESFYEEALAEADAAWDVEVELRLAAYDRGEVRAIDGQVALAQASVLARR